MHLTCYFIAFQHNQAQELFEDEKNAELHCINIDALVKIPYEE